MNVQKYECVNYESLKIQMRQLWIYKSINVLTLNVQMYELNKLQRNL